jgi:chitinase
MSRRIVTVFLALSATTCGAILALPAAAAAEGSALGAPQGVQVTSATYDSISLAWQPAAGAVSYYQILRNGVWVTSSYGTTATVRYLSASTTYTLAVRARDSLGTVSEAASVSASTKTDTGPPTIPDNLRPTGDTAYGSGLTWDASTDDRGVGAYWLFADGNAVFNGGQGVSFFELTDVDCTLLHGSTYTFTVRAMDLSGKWSTTGEAVTLTVP